MRACNIPLFILILPREPVIFLYFWDWMFHLFQHTIRKKPFTLIHLLIVDDYQVDIWSIHWYRRRWNLLHFRNICWFSLTKLKKKIVVNEKNVIEVCLAWLSIISWYCFFQSKWYLEDPTGVVQIDLSEAVSFLL